MATAETKPDVKAKILLDEANVAFSETAERKDQPNERKSDGSVWKWQMQILATLVLVQTR